MKTRARALEDPGAAGVRPHREFGSALEKALYVLDAVIAEDQPIGLAYLSDALALPKPTIHRVLVQLERSGLVERTPDRNRYHVGPGLNRRACAALGSRNQRRPTRSILSALVAEVGETCNVGVLDEHEVRYLERVECDAPLRVHIGPGHRVPAHCTALGKLLLAALPRPELERHLEATPLTRYTDNTIVDRAELESELERIRDRSFSTNDQEYGVGIVAVAVPIRALDGNVLAGVALHAPTPRMSLKRAVSHRAALQRAAARLGTAWGLDR